MNKPKVKQISETLFEVLGHSVKIQIRKGRKLLLCSCQNHTKFCNENPFCFHKELVIEFISTKKLREELNKLIEFYKLQEGIKSKFDAGIFLNDLINLQTSLLS